MECALRRAHGMNGRAAVAPSDSAAGRCDSDLTERNSFSRSIRYTCTLKNRMTNSRIFMERRCEYFDLDLESGFSHVNLSGVHELKNDPDKLLGYMAHSTVVVFSFGSLSVKVFAKSGVEMAGATSSLKQPPP